MKPADPALVAFLASSAARSMVYADVVTFYLIGGADETYRLRYTTAQQDVTAVGLDGDVAYRVWRAREMQISGLRARQSIGTKVDEQSLTLTPSPEALIQGVAARQAILGGVLDGATVRRDRFYYADFGQPPIGGAPKFLGLVGPFTALGRMDAVLKVRSGLALLDQQMPKHLTQPSCINRVFDPQCGLDEAAHAVHTTVAAGATTIAVPLAAPSTDFALGRAFFEDMGLVGVWRGIKSSDGVGLTLYEPLPRAPLTGEAVTLIPGCDRLKLSGCTRLANLARFRGFEHVPQPEKAL